LTNSRGRSPGGDVDASPVDDERQEDTLLVRWTGDGSLVLSGGSGKTKPDSLSALALELRYRVIEAPSGDVRLRVGTDEDAVLELGADLANAKGQGWRTSRIPLVCFGGRNSTVQTPQGPVQIESGAGLELQLASVRLTEASGETECGLQAP